MDALIRDLDSVTAKIKLGESHEAQLSQILVTTAPC